MSWQNDVSEYYTWVERMQRCPLGYPSSYDPKEPKGKQPGKAIVPLNIKIPHHLKPIDEAIRMLPRQLRQAMEVKYLESGKSNKERAKSAGIKYETLKRNLDRATCWLDGWFSKVRVVNHKYSQG